MTHSDKILKLWFLSFLSLICGTSFKWVRPNMSESLFVCLFVFLISFNLSIFLIFLCLALKFEIISTPSSSTVLSLGLLCRYGALNVVANFVLVLWSKTWFMLLRSYERVMLFNFFVQISLENKASRSFWRFSLTCYFSTGELLWSRIVMPMSLEEVNQENMFKILMIYEMCVIIKYPI